MNNTENEVKNFRIAFFFMKAADNLSFKKIRGVTHGQFRNIWYLYMEWPGSKSKTTLAKRNLYHFVKKSEYR